MNEKSPVSPELYQLVTSMAMEGLNQLFKTYSSSDSNTVIHVIQMYKNLLEYNNDKIMGDEFLVDAERNRINIDEVFEKIVGIYDGTLLSMLQNTLELVRAEEDETNRVYMMEGLNLILYKVTKAIRDWIRVNLTL
jgi:hypothetical protein